MKHNILARRISSGLFSMFLSGSQRVTELTVGLSAEVSTASGPSPARLMTTL